MKIQTEKLQNQKKSGDISCRCESSVSGIKHQL